MTQSDPSLVEMCRAFPARTFAVAVVPLLVAAMLGANALVYDLSPEYAAGFAFVLLAFSTGVTRQHLAAFRTRCLEERWSN